VDLEVEAGTAFSEDANSGTASADPHVFVNPSFLDAADYSIVLSVDVSNAVPTIPELATWVLMSVGLVGVAGLRRLRKRAPTGVDQHEDWAATAVQDLNG
jgi:hypothetical protein